MQLFPSPRWAHERPWLMVLVCAAVYGVAVTAGRAGHGLSIRVRLAVLALGQGETDTRTVPAANLEVAALDRTRSQQRKFRRLTAEVLERILGEDAAAATEPEPPVAPPVS